MLFDHRNHGYARIFSSSGFRLCSEMKGNLPCLDQGEHIPIDSRLLNMVTWMEHPRRVYQLLNETAQNTEQRDMAMLGSMTFQVELDFTYIS